MPAWRQMEAHSRQPARIPDQTRGRAGHGRHPQQLYVGDVTTGRRWSLTQFGVNADPTKAKLGSNYDGGPAVQQATVVAQAAR